jgi:hypothetical protein
MALPLKKRSYRAAGIKTQSIAKRLRYVEKQSYRNRPEMQTKTLTLAGTQGGGTLSVVHPCQLSQGVGVSERTKDRIRVWRLEIRGTGGHLLDHYILQKKTTSDPTISSFSTGQGPYLLDSINTNQFTEWKHYRNLYTANSNTNMKLRHSFKGGIIVKYNGSAATNVVDNEIIYVVVNRTSGSQSVDVSIRMWYTDA